MPHSRLHRLGDLQLKILKILWQLDRASVADVHQALPGGLAYTTVATMLRKLEARGLVGHQAEGRSFIYHAMVPADAVTGSMVHDLLDRLFEGSLASLVNHLLTTREVSRAELIRLEKLITSQKKKL